MKRRFETSTSGALKNPTTLPVQTENLTSEQTGQICGGDAGLGRMIRNLVAEIFGVRLPEPDVPTGTL